MLKTILLYHFMSDDKRSKKTVDLNNYVDPTDLSPKNLELGLWLATNKKRIYQIIIIILASLAAGFLLYSGYGYFYYFVFGQEQDRVLEQTAAEVNLANYHLQTKPIDLTYNQARVIATSIGSDFVVHIKNPNEKQSASFNYCFTANGKDTCSSGFILPNEEKNILLVNSTIKSPSGVADFSLQNVSWQKLKAGDIPDWNAYKNQRLNFTIGEPKFAMYDDGVYYLEFNITNNSSYGYFEVPVNITISQGSNITAVNRYIIKDLSSKQTKAVRLSWPEAAKSGGVITITPELNILDSSIYKPYGSN